MKQDREKIVAQVEKLLSDPWKIDLQELMEKFENTTDPERVRLYHALYTYVLDKRQDDLLKRDYFVY